MRPTRRTTGAVTAAGEVEAAGCNAQGQSRLASPEPERRADGQSRTVMLALAACVQGGQDPYAPYPPHI
jgi:hypothetical protein